MEIYENGKRVERKRDQQVVGLQVPYQFWHQLAQGLELQKVGF